jgi:membrane protein
MIILMMWFYITSFIILLGGQINAELEHQTNKDTTAGEDKPFGQRGAIVAETLASNKSFSNKNPGL